MLVQLDNVSIRFDHTTILKDINFTLNHGEFVYLVGESGSGKSSLLRTLYMELPPSENIPPSRLRSRRSRCCGENSA